MSTKVCYLCRKRKPIRLFRPHKRMADGFLNRCIKCDNLKRLENYRKTKSDPKKLRDLRIRSRKYVSDFAKRHGINGGTTKAKAEWAIRNRIKVNAQQTARRALKNGKIKRKSKCERCKRRHKLQMHHSDYSKPLRVKFLCVRCHAVKHRKYK